MPYSFRRRLPWGILLALLAAVAIWVMASIPYIDPAEDFDCRLDSSGERLNVEQAWYGSSSRDNQYWGWIQHFDIDLASGRIELWSHEQSIRQMLLFSRPPLRKADEDLPKSFQAPAIFATIDDVTETAGTTLVADRYLVGQRAGKLCSVDLRDPRMTRREIEAPSAVRGIHQIPGSRSFVAVEQAATAGTKAGQPPSIRLDLIRINNDGEFEFVANWLSAPEIKPSDRVAVGDQIASLNVSGTAIEFRAVENGRLLDTLGLPESFDVTKHFCYFGWNLFVAEISPSEKLLIDLQTRQRLPSSPAAGFELSPWHYVDSTSSLLNYCDRKSRGVLVHRETGRQVMTYTFHREEPIVLDENRLLFPSHAYGFSAKIVEISTGRHLQSLVPLWWVPWFVGLFLLAYLTAAIGWIRASAAEGGWAWLDAALLGGLAVLLLSIRLQTGETFDEYRSPNRFIHGICIASLTLTVIWLVLGKSRLSLRGMPLLLTLAFVVAMRFMVLGDRPTQVWHSLMPILVPVGYALLLCLVAKLLRIEFAQQFPSDAGTSNGHEESPMASKVQLRDLLLAVACVAVLLGALQPLMPTIALVGETRWLSLWSFQWIGLLLLFGAAVLSAKRWVFSCATLLAFVSAAAMTTVVLSVFVTGEDPLWLINQWSPFWFPIGAAMASMVLFLLPYRLRGWRISRRPFFSKSHLPT